MAPAPVRVQDSAGVISITINRPQAKNSLNGETVRLLCEAFEAAAKNPAARCVVLSGEGTDAFCAGADMAELVKDPVPSARRAFFDSIATLIEKIHRCPVPVIAQVHGFALAGGCGLAAACDITLASDDAVFGLPEVNVGLAAMVVMAPLSRVIGKKALSHLIMTGERISAQRALEIGLVSAVYPKSALTTEVQKLCDKLAKLGPIALKASKAAIHDVTEGEYWALLHQLADRSALLSLGAEATEGLKAFTEKRDPSWRKTS